MDTHLVSIITPTYNCSRFIVETIRSVLAQTYQNWEMIISDDCSTDGTKEIVAPFVEADKRIKYICNDRNSGAAVTRNNALRLAKGKWIAFLDSDDLWAPDKLERQIRFMEEHGYRFSYTKYLEIDDDSLPTGIFVSGPKHVSKYGMRNFCWPGCLTVMYDATKVGLIQIEDIKKNNDYAMWLKVICKADCYLLDECLASYRRGRSGSISTHSYSTLIKWHYKVWHEAEKMNPIAAAIMTVRNIFFGLYKKVMYVQKKSTKNQDL